MIQLAAASLKPKTAKEGILQSKKMQIRIIYPAIKAMKAPNQIVQDL
jgi:hypothetical protein